jgi:hypothetical protein
MPYSYNRISTGFPIIRFYFRGGVGNLGYDFVDYDTIYSGTWYWYFGVTSVLFYHHPVNLFKLISSLNPMFHNHDRRLLAHVWSLRSIWFIRNWFWRFINLLGQLRVWIPVGLSLFSVIKNYVNSLTASSVTAGFDRLPLWNWWFAVNNWRNGARSLNAWKILPGTETCSVWRPRMVGTSS